MPETTAPAAKFRRFEKVTVANGRMGDHFAGCCGTVIWCAPPWFSKRAQAWDQWGYCVALPSLGLWSSFSESDLLSLGEFDTEESQWGARHEISYDTALNDDMVVVEGSYRLPGRLWQVFYFVNDDLPEARHRFVTWDSGIKGVQFEVPRGTRINHDFIVGAMSAVFGAEAWAVVRGPDSLFLK